MTRTYAGPYRNPTEDFTVRSGAFLIEEAKREAAERDQPCADLHQLRQGVEIDPERYYIAIKEEVKCNCGCYHCKAVIRTRYRIHTSYASGKWEGAEEEGDVHENIESLHEHFEEDYDRYLDENSHAIVQMERYEMWRNEY